MGEAETDKLRSGAVATLKHALEQIDVVADAFREIRADWTDPRSEIARGRDALYSAEDALKALLGRLESADA